MPDTQQRLKLEGFDRFASLLPEPMLIVTGEGEILRANRAAEEMCAAEAGSLCGRRLASLVSEPAEKVDRYLAAWSRSRSMLPGSLTICIDGGESHSSRCDGAVIEPKSGDRSAVILLRCQSKAESTKRFVALNLQIEALSREVGERRRAEAALRAHREWLRVTLASIGDAVIAADTDGRITFINAVASELTGWTGEEASGQPLADVFRIINEETGEPAVNPFEKVMRTGEIVALANHTALVHRDGRRCPIEDSAAPIRDGDGRILGVVMVFHDVTERRRNERELREQREWLEVTLTSIGDAVIATDADGRIEFLNPVATSVTGWSQEEAGGRPIADVFQIVNEHTRETVESPVDRVLREGVIVGLANHTVLIRKDGSEVPIDDSGAPIRGMGGELVGAVLVFRDISVRHAADTALRASEARFRFMADAAPVLIWLADLTKGRTYFNKPWLEFRGRSIEQEIGDGWIEGLHPEDADRYVNAYSEAFDRREPFRMEYRLRSANGAYRWVLAHGVPWFDGNNALAGFIGCCMDVSERKRSERALRESESQLRLIFESATDYAIFTLDLEGCVTAWNSGAERLLGYTEEEIIGRHARVIFTPEATHRGQAEMELQSALEKGRAENERWHLRKEGTRFWASGVIMPMLDELGTPQGFVKIMRDHTERKRAEDELHRRTAELARANEELDRSNKELEDFAYVASHDLKEPLRGIHNYTSFLLEDHGEKLDEDGQEKLRTLMRLTQRMNSLINTLLHYSRVGRLELAIAPVSIAEALEESCDSLASFIEETQLEVRVAGPLPIVAGDRISLGEVLSNLLTNAAKYNRSERKWVEIGVAGRESAATASFGANSGAPGPEAQPWRMGGRVTLYVQDNGIGIKPQHREAVFRMFKRLHGRQDYGGGTGAGLTIVKKIVERHGGRVWIESEAGGGTTVFFTLPEATIDEQGRADTPGG